MNTEYEKQVGENIRTLRKDRKLTQDQLAAKLQVMGCDITRSALAKIEVGQRHLYPDEIKALKEILNVSYEEILN
ncbi:MAG: helix-turn-helix transcriptional regulator [Clostridia bacterium]|nr:helix-turn-helix transcriptional regulator [Clostridia bacterium]